MSKLLVMLSFLVSPMIANAYPVYVCEDAKSCVVDAKTLREFQRLGGLSSCGVIPGEYGVKVVDRNGKLLGYKCVWESPPGM
jgi:hypothetical protein